MRLDALVYALIDELAHVLDHDLVSGARQTTSNRLHFYCLPLDIRTRHKNMFQTSSTSTIARTVEAGTRSQNVGWEVQQSI